MPESTRPLKGTQAVCEKEQEGAGEASRQRGGGGQAALVGCDDHSSPPEYTKPSARGAGVMMVVDCDMCDQGGMN